MSKKIASPTLECQQEFPPRVASTEPAPSSEGYRYCAHSPDRGGFVAQEGVEGLPVRASLADARAIVKPDGESFRTPQRGGHQPVSLGSYRISHSKVIEKFKNYLGLTREYRFRLTGTNKDGEVVITVPYIHRWSEIYHKSILAKFYKLDDWMKDNPGIVTMFTLTTYQGSKSRFNNGTLSRKIKGHDLTILECFDLLKVSRTKFLNVLRNRYPGTNYVWILEPHETGYPHCHLVVFREFTEEEQNFIKQLWSEKYQAGSYTRGIEITSKASTESIHSIRNYLMKYMTKQFGSGDEAWTDGEFLFNAMVWKTSTRMWGASKELTKVMQRPEKISDIIWDVVELLTKGAQFTVWSRTDESLKPAINAGMCLDDLAPEKYVTKEFWRIKFEAIEQRCNESKYQ
jgi:hypothetical protein